MVSEIVYLMNCHIPFSVPVNYMYFRYIHPIYLYNYLCKCCPKCYKILVLRLFVVYWYFVEYPLQLATTGNQSIEFIKNH